MKKVKPPLCFLLAVPFRPLPVHCRSLSTIPCTVCTLFCLLLLGGCSGPKAPPRYELSGAVTYDGKPVPAGYIIFAPDRSKGNDGPGASAEIKNGVYCTEAGKGTVGGPHTATITGFDGKSYHAGPITNPMGKPLFSTVQIAVDLPKQTSTHDFAIPFRKGE
jgi:hypothetical protein